MNNAVSFLITLAALGSLSCTDAGEQPLPAPPDDQLFALFMQRDPFPAYTLFPRADSVTSGTLNGSTAHQPFVRVSMNAIALGALEGDTLPSGSTFPDGSTILKEIRTSGATVLYAILHKDRNNPLAGNGWLWAEYETDGTPYFSVTNRGAGCISCHSREQGPLHDYVRTFERQR